MKQNFKEFLGTMIMIFIGASASSFASSYVQTLGIAISYGLGYIIASYIINEEYASFNPILSFSSFLNKKITLKNFFGLIISQILGAYVAYFLVTMIITSANMGTVLDIGLGIGGYKELSGINLSFFGAIISEIIFSFILALTYLTAKENKSKNYVISLSIIIIHLISTCLTSTSANPASNVAASLFLKGSYLKQLWVFVVFPLIGTILATLTNKFLKK